MYTLTWTNTFTRTARRFLKKHPELKGQFYSVIKQLETNPNSPSLNLHPLKGTHKDKLAISLTYSYRIVITIILEDRNIILLDIGTHDHVYK
jgi:mRNA-degrading endonuclease YafQ of YafQ-DinJ toxin-antitoxin module